MNQKHIISKQIFKRIFVAVGWVQRGIYLQHHVNK